MSGLYLCSACCACISLWGVLQLGVMGALFKFEATPLLEDVEAHRGDYADVNEYIKKTEENYAAQAINCWVVAAMYMLTLLISLYCLHSAKKMENAEALRRDDDEYSCKKDEFPRLA